MKNQREFPRIGEQIDIYYSDLNSDSKDDISAMAENISLGGVYMLISEPSEADAKFKILFHIDQQGRSINLITNGRVIRSGRIKPEDISSGGKMYPYYAAVMFDEPFTELSLLLEK